MFRQVHIPLLTRTFACITCTGLSPTSAFAPEGSTCLTKPLAWSAFALYLCGVSVDVLSYEGADVSEVPRVRHFTLCIQGKLPNIDAQSHSSKLPCCSDFQSTLDGFPHSSIYGSIYAPPRSLSQRIILHRLCMPRHPPVPLRRQSFSLPMLIGRPDQRHQRTKTSFSRSVRGLRSNIPIIWRGLTSPPTNHHLHPHEPPERNAWLCYAAIAQTMESN